jgi:ubiquinone/menaquinone biosynthesis C-methylase UbiE
MKNGYKAKHAYKGSIATDYEKDRIGEPLWAYEQDYVERWVASLPQQTSMLDLPVGTGRFFDFYRAQNLKVKGIDISPEMIAESKRKIVGESNWIELAEGDAEKLSLPDQSIDYVLCWRLAHLLPRATLGRVLCEFRRVARKEIVVEVLSIEDEGKSRWLRKIKSWVRPLWLKLKLRRADKPWSHITNYGYTISEITALILQANLVVRSTVVIKTDSGQSATVFHLCCA